MTAAIRNHGLPATVSKMPAPKTTPISTSTKTARASFIGVDGNVFGEVCKQFDTPAPGASQLLAGLNAPSKNPDGIPSQSPGLRGTSHPGSWSPTISNRNTVAAIPRPCLRLEMVVDRVARSLVRNPVRRNFVDSWTAHYDPSSDWDARPACRCIKLLADLAK